MVFLFREVRINLLHGYSGLSEWCPHVPNQCLSSKPTGRRRRTSFGRDLVGVLGVRRVRVRFCKTFIWFLYTPPSLQTKRTRTRRHPRPISVFHRVLQICNVPDPLNIHFDERFIVPVKSTVIES